MRTYDSEEKYKQTVTVYNIKTWVIDNSFYFSKK